MPITGIGSFQLRSSSKKVSRPAQTQGGFPRGGGRGKHMGRGSGGGIMVTIFGDDLPTLLSLF